MNRFYQRAVLLVSLILACHSPASGQALTVTGTVTSSDDGGALPGVNVYVKGTTRGTITDLEGRYTIDVVSGSEVLFFSFVGYVDQEFQVGDRSEINVNLEPEIIGLDEIVVIG